MFSTSELLFATTYVAAMISVRYAFRWTRSHGVYRTIRSFTGSRVREYTGTKHLPSSTAKPLPEESKKYLTQLEEHQSKVPKLSLAEEVRSLLHTSSGYGILCTNSKNHAGFPFGSVVGFQLDEDDQGKPFFALSHIAAHTKDLLTDGRSCLVITSKDFKGADDGRVSIMGSISIIPSDSELKSKMRDLYLKKHKNAYWIDFGDFDYFKMDSIEGIRYVGGFARAGNITPEDFYKAKPDPLCSFAEPIMKHMNEDHADANQAMVEHSIGIPCRDAKMIGLDQLGMTFHATFPVIDDTKEMKVRIPFIRPPQDRKQVKEIVIEMTRTAQAKLKQ